MGLTDLKRTARLLRDALYFVLHTFTSIQVERSEERLPSPACIFSCALKCCVLERCVCLKCVFCHWYQVCCKCVDYFHEIAFV